MNTTKTLITTLILCSTLAPAALAQPQIPLAELAAFSATSTESFLNLSADTPLTLNQIQVQRSKHFTEADFAPIIDPLLGQTTVGELRAAIAQINQLYTDHHFFTSRAILLPQALEQGKLVIGVIEGNQNDNVTQTLEALRQLYALNAQNPQTLTFNELAPSERTITGTQLPVGNVLAQVDPHPNRDRFLQTPDDPLPQPLPENGSDLTPNTESSDPSSLSDTTPLTINSIDVIGSTIFTDADFDPILTPLLGNTTLGDLNQAVEQITQLYIVDGYLTSNAVLPSQPLDSGNLTIEVIEGTLESIEVNGLSHLNESYITSRLALAGDAPLNVNQLEDQIRLLQLDPNLDNFDVSLQSGDSVGSSNLILDVDEAKRFFGTAFIDNYSPRSVGSTRGGVNLGYRNLAGQGDVLGFAYTQTFAGGLDIWDLSYSIPLNPMNGTLEVGGAINRNKIITQPFDDLEIRGESEFYRLSFRQPLVRTATEEFALSIGFDHRDGQTFVFDDIAQAFSEGADTDGITRTSVFRFGQDYTKRDANGAWSFRSQFSWGTELLDATTNAGGTPDGQFLSWLGQVARVQRLDNIHTLIIQADLQLTGDNLLASEGFSLGGQQTLRGYRQGARNGDNGFRFSIEDRITLFRREQGVTLMQLAPFFDYGLVWNNADNTGQITGEHRLAGFGMGLLMQVEDSLTMRLDYAYAVEDTLDRQSDIQDDGFYFSVNYAF
ncbi:MAG: BamA/TamA family outer membrane protein [Spirulina sp. SIO3F2]|nr:BamA/TamA family outer membrane protein [Spirulina sp. SIO3F2]